MRQTRHQGFLRASQRKARRKALLSHRQDGSAGPGGHRRVVADRLAGAVLLVLGLVLLAMAASHLVPDGAGQFLAIQARMLDSLRPHLAAVVALLAGALVLLGAWRMALAGSLLALAALASMVWAHQARLAPSGDRTDLTVLWFNAYYENATPVSRLEAALRDSPADIVVLGESTPFVRIQDRLADLYPYQVGCSAQPFCGITLLSKWPLEAVRVRNLRAGPERFVRVLLRRPDRAVLAFQAIHMGKPWYLGHSGSEETALDWAMRTSAGQPLVLVGDFNAAPWSRRMQDLARQHGLLYPARPVATWPARLGRWGVPIDHVLVRGGVGVVSVTPWEAGLGSNHRGLLARLSLPPA